MSELPIYVVYFNTKDFPGEYVSRRQLCGAVTACSQHQEVERTCHLCMTTSTPFVKVDPDLCARARTLEGVRKQLPPGLHRIPPMPGDDPVVVEIWL